MKNDHRNIFAREALPPKGTSVFLAGPSPRSKDVQSWREGAVALLRSYNFDGPIVIPEDRDGPSGDFDFDEQVSWEYDGLRGAKVIGFYVPRDMKILPGLTTNDEWGYWKTSGKCVFAAPQDAQHVKYQFWWARKLNVPTANNLPDFVREVIKLYAQIDSSNNFLLKS